MQSATYFCLTLQRLTTRAKLVAFGMFEDERFSVGTRKFVQQLRRMTDAGIKVYVGGGEGGTALEKYGSQSYVTYVFTAGGTVLNALGSEPVPYLVALNMAADGVASL